MTTFKGLSPFPVFSDVDFFSSSMPHISLAKSADAILIAPATANVIAKLAHGVCDDLLTTVCLATQADIFIAPAMNQQMWSHPATQANVELLKARGVKFIGPADGEQGCGDHGFGRMCEPTEILSALSILQNDAKPLLGKSVLVTAGPTREPIDPVRFIGNYSSGKMGYAIAEAAFDLGASVKLISGPTALNAKTGILTQYVNTAEEMYQGVMSSVQSADVFFSVAAVADYKPVQKEAHKIKKTAEKLSIALERNKDILHAVSQLKSRPVTVGFCAETDNLIEHAQQKLQLKKLLVTNRNVRFCNK